MSDNGLAGCFSPDLYEFARQVVWFDGPERRAIDPYALLAFIMAKSVPSAYRHARECFGFTDEDFREALRRAKPGLFVYPEQWAKWNKELEIDPPLPMPKKVWFTDEG